MNPHAHAHLKLSLDPPDLAGLDELSARVFRAFMTALRLHQRRMFKALSAHGVHPGQMFCLRILREHEDLTQRQLAEMMHIAPPTITKMLQSLERSGAVERRPDDSDQRVWRVRLTPEGRQLEEDIRKVSAEYVQATIGTLSEDDKRELARLLEVLGTCFENAGMDACDRSTDGAAGRAAGVAGRPEDVL